MRNEEILYEQEIRISDILLRVIRRWKKVLVVAIIMTTLLVGYAVLPTVNQGPALMMTASEIIEAEARIEEIEAQVIANEEALEASESAIAERESLIEANEIAMKDREDEIERIKQSIKKTEDLEEIYQTMVDTMMAVDIVEKDFASEVMNFTVKVADAQDAIFTKESRIATLNREIRDLEKMNEVTIPKEIEEIQEQMTELEEEIDEICEEADDLKVQMEKTVLPELSFVKVIIFAMIGFVLGVIMSTGYIAVVMIFDNKVHNTQVFEDGYGLFLLGTVTENKKNSIFCKRIRKLLGFAENVCNAEDEEIIVSKIKTFSNTNRVMAIGTIEEKRIRDVVDKLKESTSCNGLEFVSASNPMYSSESMNQLKNYELILVEKIDKTKINEIAKLMRFLDKSGATVLGVIAV